MRIMFDKESCRFIVLDPVETKRVLRAIKGQKPEFTNEVIQQTVINSEIDNRLSDFFYSIVENAKPGIIETKFHDFHVEIKHLRPDGSIMAVTVPYTTCVIYWQEPRRFIETFL